MDETPEINETSNRSVWLLLSYLWITTCCVFLPVIPMVVEREDEFAKWHAKHGLILALLWFLLSVGLLGLANFMGMLDWDSLKTIFYILWGVAGSAFLVLCLVAMMKAFAGERWTLSVLRGFLDKLDF
ncbi:MAG: hypothetical protein RBU37_06840 [Myxococcota bacterium]|jgi:uncharacterized membrane protein|nr:hypothetical protein [Myxococcota bacterium]